jgi:hypothetical protein
MHTELPVGSPLVRAAASWNTRSVEASNRDWFENDVIGRVARLRSNPNGFRVFGASAHAFTLRPVIETEELTMIERDYGFQVPDSYRSWLLEVGNGGAGPGYGLFPLGSEGDTVDNTHDWIPELLGDPGRPFPHAAAWNLPEDLLSMPEHLTPDDGTKWMAEYERSYFDTSWVDGSIPIGHLGCAMWIRLVVNGEHAGQVWLDNRASDQGIHPMVPQNFDEWFLDWLSSAEQSAR